MSANREAWADFLNPEVIRNTFVSAGLFLVAHEMLLDSIKRHPLDFFANRWTQEGPEESEKYRKEVLGLDPKGANDPVRGSIAWLRRMGALDAGDELAIKRVTDERNRLAHELSGMIHGTKPRNFVEHYPTLVGLVSKVEKWWIINVEMATDPDFDGQDVDLDQIVPGVILSLELLSQVALGEGEEAWEFHRWFVQEWPRPH